MFARLPNLTRCTALLLALTLPFCCCIVGAVSGIGSPCCATLDASTCCNAQTVDWLEEYLEEVTPEQERPSDSCKGMSCCIKGFTLSHNWSPPCDTFGQPTTFDCFYLDSHALLSEHLTIQTHPPPNLLHSQLGFSDAPSIRGVVILQV